MSQQNFQQQQQYFFSNQSAGSINDYPNFGYNVPTEQEDVEAAKQTTKRRDDTKRIVEQLYKATLIQRPGERVVTRTGGRKNKNEILGLTLARLNKEKHLHGSKYSRDAELLRGIQMSSNNGDFVLVIRTNGRIVAMSDEVEQHLGKSMRSLYTQCTNIFECLDKNDGNKLRLIFNASGDLSCQEHRLVCTFRLPKGKRPSRVLEDIKAMTMTGHFYSCHGSSSTHERLFIARCEALVSSTTNKSSSSQTATTMLHNNNGANSTLKFTLNEDMTLNMVSSNVKDILGYSRVEMMGNWLGRYLATNDLKKFETNRQKHFQGEQQQQQSPTSICDIFDMYTNNGDGRLTFLYQLRPIRERRSKSIKFSIVAQLIDPSLRDEYNKYTQSESKINPAPIQAEQVNLVPSSISKTREDSVMANSPSLIPGLLVFDDTTSNDFIQQFSPFGRSLSNFVAPVSVDDEFWEHLFDYDNNQYSSPTTATDLQYLSTKSFDHAFSECQSEEGLASFIDEYLSGYSMSCNRF